MFAEGLGDGEVLSAEEIEGGGAEGGQGLWGGLRDVSQESGLILLDGDHVIAAGIDNFLADVALTIGCAAQNPAELTGYVQMSPLTSPFLICKLLPFP